MLSRMPAQVGDDVLHLCIHLVCYFFAKMKIDHRTKPRGRLSGESPREGGFTIVAVVVVSLLLTMLALGILQLATFQVRSSDSDLARQQARGNARLALVMAIGELQRFAGPDQRVTATGDILGPPDGDAGAGAGGEVVHPHWLGVWSTRREDGSSFWQRDDLAGGLRDTRVTDGWNAEEEVLSYLVSGNEGGRAVLDSDLRTPLSRLTEAEESIELVAEGSLGESPAAAGQSVSAPLVEMADRDGVPTGGYAYWVGDLNVRANVATENQWAQVSDERRDDFSLMASQQAEIAPLSEESGEEDLALTSRDRARISTSKQLELATSRAFAQRNWHDLTVTSRGVLADVQEGGLKKNLSVYLDGAGAGGTDNSATLDELRDSDNLVGPRNPAHAAAQGLAWEETRYRESSPTFGLLRDFSQSAATGEREALTMRAPQTVSVDSTAIGGRAAFANDRPVELLSRTRGDLLPILVEGSMYTTYSYHPNPPGFALPFNIRSHHWPKAVLWNPYDAPIKVPQSVLMMQLNTRNDFRTRVFGVINTTLQWISWGGGTRTPPPAPDTSFGQISSSENYNDPYSGMWYFTLPDDEIGPGECYVYTTEEAREYDPENVLNNRLSSEVGPDPARNLYISSTEFGDPESNSGFPYRIAEFAYHPSAGNGTQADDSRMMWKDASGVSNLTIFEFDALPTLQSISCSLQYGAGREPLVAWNENRFIPVEFTELEEPTLTQLPDVRTREGFRLRWFEEHPSNTGILNNPAGAGLFETAPLANWNPRAAYALRTPWDNVGGDIGQNVGGASASGPWFFGLYTRDLYDQAVSWQDQEPFFERGRYRGNPFGLPQEGRLRNVLYQIPREDIGILSLAQFQHAKLSEFVWQPGYAVGNSLVDPRLGFDGMTGTAPSLEGSSQGGWDAMAIGFSSDTRRASDREEWARFGRFILRDLPEDENLVYDLSFELNQSLWDEFFLSSGTEQQRAALVNNGEPLPNGRLRPVKGATPEALNSLTESASALMVDGAFNVNSTSVAAWKAMLASTRSSGLGQEEHSAIPRMTNPLGGEWTPEDGEVDSEDAWSGFRSLSDEEVDRLAREIVNQVKIRGPFLSLADFVNRRLVNDIDGERTGLMGPLQAAIEAAGLNQSFSDSGQGFALDNESSLPDYSHPDNIADATRLEQRLQPNSKAWGAPGYLTQGDLLQVLGPVLTARSDTFIIRSYGDARDRSGKVIAQAWCEAVVQRLPQPIAPDEQGLNPDLTSPAGRFGRKFELQSFRWLKEENI